MSVYDKVVLQQLETSGLQTSESFQQTTKPAVLRSHCFSRESSSWEFTCTVQAILNGPAPSDVSTLCSVLQLMSWYSKLIPDFANIAPPVRASLQDPNGFSWSEEAEQSLTKVKWLLANCPALALLDPTLHMIVSTDVFDYGLGAILSQVSPDGIERSFASRTLSTAECKYSTVEKEGLACMWAIERCRTYLWGHRFTQCTDHQALTTLLTCWPC